MVPRARRQAPATRVVLGMRDKPRPQSRPGQVYGAGPAPNGAAIAYLSPRKRGTGQAPSLLRHEMHYGAGPLSVVIPADQ